MALAQADEAIVSGDLDHVDTVVQFHRHPLQAAIQHRAGGDQEGRLPGRPGRHLQVTLYAALQAGCLGAHPFHGVVPAGAAFDAFEHVSRPQPAHQGVDGSDVHGFHNFLLPVAALAVQDARLQGELRPDHPALEAQLLPPGTVHPVAVVEFHGLAGVCRRIHRAGIEQEAEVRQAAGTLLPLDPHDPRQQVRDIHPIEQQPSGPDHRHHRDDGDRIRHTPAGRSAVQLDGVQLGTIQLHQTSSAVMVQVWVLVAGSRDSTGGSQKTMNTGRQHTLYSIAPGTAVMVKLLSGSTSTGVSLQSPPT
ncbi:hypothetical protein FQZ97_554970 [compost metagenome]